MKHIRFISLLLVCVFLASCFSACFPKENVTMEGVYSLKQALQDGIDVTEDFLLYQVSFDGAEMKVVINYMNMLISRNSTYKATAEQVVETYQDETFEYTVEGNTLKTYYEDGGARIQVILEKEAAADGGAAAVDFESVLFGEDINDTKKFNYCPSILTEVDDQGRTVMHIWYCTNKQSGIIMDHIGYRTGALQEDGKWVFSEEEIVLAPTAGTWDGRHTCDPSVIKGEFRLNGETYNYLMSYLGCTTEDYQKNETGLAVAKEAGGPWVKVDNLNPIVPWFDDGNEAEEQQKYENLQGTTSIYWGTGMPSLISIDGKGEVLLFYSSTKRGIGVRRIDLSDLNNPVEKFTTGISHNSVVNSSGVKCNLAIADFAYDPVAKRLYVASVTNERKPADVTLTRVNSHSMVCYVEGLENMEAVASALQSGNYKWNTLGYVGPSETGWNRNHNPGLVRTEGGFIPDSNRIGVVVSTGNNDWPNENIFTYRLFGQWLETK